MFLTSYALQIPDEWKRGVKVTIEPTSPEFSIEHIRKNERIMNEFGPKVRRKVEEHFEELEREANH